MFGKRCTLCGGKLDSHGVCKECGLDNNKNDKNYRVNQSSCDNQPLTHVPRGKAPYQNQYGGHSQHVRHSRLRRRTSPVARQPQKATRRTRPKE